MSESVEAAIGIFKNCREACLGTVEEGGRPYVSAVSPVYAAPEETGTAYGCAYLFLSALARHTRNLQKNPAVSLLAVDHSSGRPAYESPRATALGRASAVTDPAQTEKLKTVYLRQFPDSGQFFALPDFRFYAVEISEIHYIAGFGRIRTFK